MHVSVVISTLDRAGPLAAALDALRRQTYDDLEVVVVNGPSSDETEALLASWAGALKVVDCPQRNLSVSRNLGIEAAAGDVVAFTDDDAVPEPTWIEELVAGFDGPQVVGVGGLVLDASGVRPQFRHTVMDRLGRPDFDRVPPFDELVVPGADPYLYLNGNNMAFRREALVAARGFDEHIEYDYDESDLALRLVDAGGVLRSLEGARVHHKNAPSHLRQEPGVPTDPFASVKNRTAFALRHGLAAGYARADALAAVEAHLAHLRGSAAQHHAEGRLPDLERFLARLDDGLEAGLAQAEQPQRLRALTPPAAPFRAFPLLRPDDGPPLHVAMLSLEWPPAGAGGVARATKDVAAAVAAEGHHVEVVTRDGGPHRIDVEDGVWVQRVPWGKRWLPDLDGRPAGERVKHVAAVQLALDGIHARRPLDVVVGPLWAAEPVVAAHDPRWATVVWCQTPMRVVADLQPETAALRETEPQIALEAQTAASAARLQGISAAVLDEVRRAIPAARGVPSDVTPLGAKDRAASVVRHREDDAIDVLFAGRLEPRKGIDVLLEAALPLLAARTDVRLRVVGPDPDGHALRHEGTERLRFDGELPDDELWQAYADADIVCAPSRYESFGLVLLEGMVFGKPVVGCDAGGMPEVVGDAGVLVPPGDAAALRTALERLVDDPAERARLGTAARARYEERFTPQAAARRFAASWRLASAAPGATGATAATERLLRDVAGLEPLGARRGARMLLDPVAFPVDREALLRDAARERDDAAFVELVYRALLDRPADDEMVAFHTRGLRDRDQSRVDVVRIVATSDEARAREVPPQLAERFATFEPGAVLAALRAARLTGAGLAAPLGLADDAADVSAELHEVLEVPSFQRALAELAPVLRAAWLPTAPELDAALRRASRLPAREAVALGYLLLLGRAADPDGLAGHVAALRSSGRFGDVAQALADSGEGARRGIDREWAAGLSRRLR